MTLEQIKEDIKNGKCTTIYYSCFTLWWCHTEEDLKKATEIGKQSTKDKINKLLDNPKVPEDDKKRMREKLEDIDDSITPLDTSGSPLYQMSEPMKWITEAEKKPTHFGKYGIESFIKTHHQNLNGWTPEHWDSVNAYLERTKQTE